MSGLRAGCLAGGRDQQRQQRHDEHDGNDHGKR